jgi:hypothetical protein
MHTGLAIGGCDCDLRHRSLWNLAKAEGRRRDIERICATDDHCGFHDGIERAIAIGIVTQIFYTVGGHLQLGRHPGRKNQVLIAYDVCRRNVVHPFYDLEGDGLVGAIERDVVIFAGRYRQRDLLRVIAHVEGLHARHCAEHVAEQWRGAIAVCVAHHDGSTADDRNIIGRNGRVAVIIGRLRRL